MKKIVYSQRVDVIESYNERRDCTDQNVAAFLYACGYLPIPINNIPDKTEEFIREIGADGIMFTGGNDLSAYGGNAPERDETEQKLITEGIEKHIPIYGFCRGMQVIVDYFGGTLERTEGHVKTRHVLSDEPVNKGYTDMKYNKTNSIFNLLIFAMLYDNWQALC